jgi:hypothetical protein
VEEAAKLDGVGFFLAGDDSGGVAFSGTVSRRQGGNLRWSDDVGYGR